MAWGDLASNQMVSYADATDSGFTLQPGQTNPGTLQCMTKNDALTKYVLDSSYMTSYASNQLVPKSVWVSGIVGNSFIFGSTGSTSSSGACGLSNTGLTLYSADTTLVVGSRLWYDSGLTNPFAVIENVEIWWHSGTKSYRINDYPNPSTFAPYIAEIVNCSTSHTIDWTNTSYASGVPINLVISVNSVPVVNDTQNGSVNNSTFTVYDGDVVDFYSEGTGGGLDYMSLQVYDTSLGYLYSNVQTATYPYLSGNFTVSSANGTTITIDAYIEVG